MHCNSPCEEINELVSAKHHYTQWRIVLIYNLFFPDTLFGTLPRIIWSEGAEETGPRKRSIRKGRSRCLMSSRLSLEKGNDEAISEFRGIYRLPRFTRNDKYETSMTFVAGVSIHN